MANPNEKKMAAMQTALEEQKKKKKRLVFEPPKSRKKLILFFVGGVSFSEISELRSIESLDFYDLIIGTDELLTPQSYLKDLLEMKERD